MLRSDILGIVKHGKGFKYKIDAEVLIAEMR